MVEYIKRYDEFAEFMCSHGYYVVGNDHLGHGKSVQSKSEYGFFNEKYGNACVIGDMHTLRQRTMKKYPDVPYFMLGHSMGSSLLRQYVQMYGNGLAGAEHWQFSVAGIIKVNWWMEWQSVPIIGNSRIQRHARIG